MFQYTVLLLFLVHCGESNLTSKYSKEEVTVSYLDVAVEMIKKAQLNMPTCGDTERNFTKRPVDCADIILEGQRQSGVYAIWPMSRLSKDIPLHVYCDMDTDGGGWTLIQRRGNYGSPYDFFFKGWKSYKEGFGNIREDFWLGNDNIFALTNQKLYSVRFDLQDVKLDRKYALYKFFWISDEFSDYTLNIAVYSGDAGDAMIDKHNNQKFSTKDVDNDKEPFNSCANKFKGAWWYSNCFRANLNGLYLRGEKKSNSTTWYKWKFYESLDSTEIKIRPRNFILTNVFAIPPA